MLKKVILLVILVALALYIIYLLFLFSPFYVENYCTAKAKTITGSNGNKQVPLTKADVQTAPILQGNTSKTIPWHTSEELKCEREHSIVVF